jgi:hypothetical protein
MDNKVKSKKFVVFIMLNIWILVLWLLDTVLYPEDRGRRFPSGAGKHLPDFTVP